jgi:ABC-2 type transport system ATP-binding protein
METESPAATTSTPSAPVATPPPLPVEAAAPAQAEAATAASVVIPRIVLPSPGSSGLAIQTIGLTKTFGKLTALESLNLELEKGDLFGFIGPNGAGKTTTMKILAGLLKPTSGSARLLGREVFSNGQFVRRNVGYMPDFIGVYEDLKVSEYLEFFASAYGIKRSLRRKVVADVLELTDLNYKKDAMVESLSRGMTQRLSLARVLVHDPPVLLLDEPASGLDPRARIEIRELLRELQRLGKTILVSSHILSELGEFCNKFGIIERGKLLVVGTLEDLMDRARARSAIAISVVGDSEPAVLLLQSDNRVRSVEIRDGQIMVTLADETVHHHFLIELLTSRGFKIDSIAPYKLRLEDVFVRLTKGIVQ